MKFFYYSVILLLYSFTVKGEYDEDCRVRDVYRIEDWGGEEVLFYVYVPENEVLEITAIREYGLFTRLYFSPSQNNSKIIDSEDGIPRYLTAMKKSNDWFQFKIQSQAGKINVSYEPSTNGTVSIDQPTQVKEFKISSNFISFCRKGKPSWMITKDKNITIPIHSSQEITFYITSITSFFPVFYLNGRNYTFNHSRNSLEPMTYYMILEARTDMVKLYTEKKTSVLMEVKIEKRPRYIQVSSIKGEYLLTISVQDSFHQPTDPSHTGTPRNQTDKVVTPVCNVWKVTTGLSLAVVAVLMFIIIIFIYQNRTRNKVLDHEVGDETDLLLTQMLDSEVGDENALLLTQANADEEVLTIKKIKDELLDLSAIMEYASDEENIHMHSLNDQYKKSLMVKLDEAQKLTTRLGKIVCQKNPLLFNEYIDALIQAQNIKSKNKTD